MIPKHKQQNRNRQIWFDQNLKPLCFKGHCQESEKIIHGMEEDTCKSYMW